jgi:hypothetical protein
MALVTAPKHNNNFFKHRGHFNIMLQNIPKEKIIDIVKQGPTFPAKIAKQLGGGGDTMLIGAILSTLISSGDIKVSTLKVGGSPLYYIPDQESKLEDFLNYMNDKDKNAFRLLKEKKVLQDSDQEPLTRVSLRTIKDFAKQFEVDYQNKKVLFWRFYSVSQEEAVVLAKKLVSIVKPIEVEEPIIVPEPMRIPEQKQEHKSEHKASLILEPKPAAADRVVEKSVAAEHHADIVQQVLEEPVSVAVPSEKVHDKHEHHEKSEQHEHKVEKHERASTEKHGHDSEKESEKHSDSAKESTEKHSKPKTHTPKAPKAEYNFYQLILDHILSKKLDLISKEKVKKTEYDMVLKNHSNNEYIYCKAKDKNTISEGDLAPALIFAQNKKMPCLFLSTGELTKKVELLITKEFSGLTFERIIVENKSS